MSFSTTYRAIAEMIGREALDTNMARGIARKAGLRVGPGGELFIASEKARTLVDVYIVPLTPYENYQWKVDLTGATYIRIASRSYVEGCELWYSLSGAADGSASDDLIVTDWLPLVGHLLGIDSGLESDREIEQFARDFLLRFKEIPEELRIPLRLTFNLGGDVFSGPNLIPNSEIDGPFNVALQVL